MSHQVVTMPMISNTLVSNDYTTDSATFHLHPLHHSASLSTLHTSYPLRICSHNSINTCDDVQHNEAKALHSVQLYSVFHGVLCLTSMHIQL